MGKHDASREKIEERNRNKKGESKKAWRGRAQTDYLPLQDKQGGM